VRADAGALSGGLAAGIATRGLTGSKRVPSASVRNHSAQHAPFYDIDEQPVAAEVIHKTTFARPLILPSFRRLFVDLRRSVTLPIKYISR
jgi:hypothetical protein